MHTKSPPASRTVTHRLKFLLEFLRSPFEVGSPIATASRTVERMLAGIEWDAVDCFVEYGPGAGEFTRFILEHLPAQAQLIAIESEEQLADHLRESIKDERLIVYASSATRACELLGETAVKSVDYILSGIPFSSIEEAQRVKIAGDASRLLKPTGRLLAYQVRRSIEGHLNSNFGAVKRQREWLNLPPYHLYWCSNPK